MSSPSPLCKACRAPLELRQSCLNISWYCLACGKNHGFEEFLEFLDPAMEERLANVRCDRI